MFPARIIKEKGVIELIKACQELWKEKFKHFFIGVDTSKYASDTFRGLHEILQQATTFRFDGSDLMPGWVGAGSFWTGMVDYTNGKSAEEVADAIQASWEAGQ